MLFKQKQHPPLADAVFAFVVFVLWGYFIMEPCEIIVQ